MPRLGAAPVPATPAPGTGQAPHAASVGFVPQHAVAPARRHVPIDDESDDDAQAVVARFFEAFARRDPADMAACYHAQASYSSPVFPDLRGPMPGVMWALALSDADALELEWSVAFADARKAQVTWRARWRRGGRAMRIEAASTLALWDGGIVRQVDEFRLGPWVAQSVGVWGRLVAWLPPVQRLARRRARGALDAFVRRQQAGGA